jgi:hypothetical protein
MGETEFFLFETKVGSKMTADSFNKDRVSSLLEVENRGQSGLDTVNPLPTCIDQTRLNQILFDGDPFHSS